MNFATEERLSQGEQRYPENIGPNMKIRENLVSRGGYRLPTKVKRDYSSRVGGVTRWRFGNNESMLIELASFSKSAQGT